MSDSHSEKQDKITELRREVVSRLQLCYDPELSIDIVNLGLIYEITFDQKEHPEEPPILNLKMTFTTPLCPLGDEILAMVKERLKTIEGIESILIELVFEPPWTKEMISSEGQILLNL